MEMSKGLAARLKEVLLDGQWVIGTNFKDQIVDLSWQMATEKIDSLNTIADLTFHVNYYIHGVAQVLEGGPLEIRDKFSFDYPPIQDEETWQSLVQKFIYDAERFVGLVEKMNDGDLLAPFIQEQYGSYLRNINTLIEHSYYHFGQIVIIRKMINKRTKQTVQS